MFEVRANACADMSNRSHSRRIEEYVECSRGSHCGGRGAVRVRLRNQEWTCGALRMAVAFLIVVLCNAATRAALGSAASREL